MISVIAHYNHLRKKQDTLSLQIGAIFLLAAGIVLNLMAVIQSMQFDVLGRKINQASNELKQMREEIL